MSVFIPYKECAAHTITMVKQILAGKTVETNSKTSNGAISVPTYLYSPVAVEKGTIKKYLIDPGYFTEEDLN